ncbi:hypothetical protein NMY22_g906 [Coprinellus aureogranulatus]|nr:hypothetical protein NMY22_g906 [Coprinellus aureogranulatus]
MCLPPELDLSRLNNMTISLSLHIVPTAGFLRRDVSEEAAQKTCTAEPAPHLAQRIGHKDNGKGRQDLRE